MPLSHIAISGVTSTTITPDANSSTQASRDGLPGSFEYALGAFGLTAVFGCAFFLLCCYIKGSDRNSEFQSAKWARSSASTESAGTRAPSQRCVHPAPLTAVAAEEEDLFAPARRNLGRLQVRRVIVLERRQTADDFRVPNQQCGNASVIDSLSKPRRAARGASVCLSTGHVRPSQIPGAECDVILGSWVGSPAWAAARASRRKRAQSFVALGIRRTRSVPSLTERASLEAESGPVVAWQSDDQKLQKASIEETLADAKTAVDMQLQSTLREDLALRKKTFKFLCAKWHPDKHISRDADMATEVFQYLQEQKSWYLED